jgi:hypothetical protein
MESTEDIKQFIVDFEHYFLFGKFLSKISERTTGILQLITTNKEKKMETENFNKLTENFFENCKAILGTKASEYAVGIDRLRNFKRAGALSIVEPETALLGMLNKHIVSIYDFIDEIEDEKEPRDLSKWHEKLVDVVNYIGPLLWALLNERYNAEQNEELM